jgi:putative ABC transport system permease protein
MAQQLSFAEETAQDVRYTLRTLRRNRGYAFVAVATLAIGIGATTAIFSVVNALLIRPLPYHDSDRLVRLVVHAPPAPAADQAPRRPNPSSIDLRTIVDLRSASRTLSHTGLLDLSLVTMTGGSETARLQGTRMSPSLFQMLGVVPLHGRTFVTSDEAADAAPVVVISHATWLRYFGGAADAIGRTVLLTESLGRDAKPVAHVVVGVMPPEFAYPDPQSHFWTPIRMPLDGTGARGPLIAQLAPGASPEVAAAEIAPFVRERMNHLPTFRYEFVREQDEIVKPVRPALLILSVAVAFVLLIACVNVANLVLARMDSRQREIAVRLALGAGRARLIRHLLVESMLLALAGGIGGIALALGGVVLLRRIGTTLARFDLGIDLLFPRLHELSIDGTVLLFTLAASITAGLLAGLLPALRHTGLAQRALRSATGSEARGLVGAPGSSMRNALIVVQISLAIVLLAGGGLLVHSFVRLSSVDPGYDPSRLLTFQVVLSPDRYTDSDMQRFAEQLTERLRAEPGVEAAAYARQMPMVALFDTVTFTRFVDNEVLGGDVRIVSSGYLEALRTPILAGRSFDDRDTAGRVGAIVINEAMARTAFRGVNPIGVQLGGARGTRWEIVGVVRDVRQFGFDRAPDPQLFLDARQSQGLGLPAFPVGVYFLVRTQGDPMVAAPLASRVARELNRDAGVYNIVSMDDVVANKLSRPRLYAVLLGVFAAIAVVLAAIGLYGVMAYAVTRRTGEIGVRVALGAERRQVMTLVLRQSLVLTAVGMTLGLAGAAAVTRYLEALLFGLTPLDPATFAAVMILFIAVAIAASYVPTRRALRIDPVVALRTD